MLASTDVYAYLTQYVKWTLPTAQRNNTPYLLLN
jgi:hypothetical protein